MASATYLSEVAGKARRGFWSSFHYVTLIMGQLLALGVLILLQRTMPPEVLAEWGWRIPFFVGAALAVVVFWIRMGLRKTESWEKAKAAGTPPSQSRLLFLKHPRETFIVMGLTAAGSLPFYAYTTYMQKYLVNSAWLRQERGDQMQRPGRSASCFSSASWRPRPSACVAARVRRPASRRLFSFRDRADGVPVFVGIANAGSPWIAFAILFGALPGAVRLHINQRGHKS